MKTARQAYDSRVIDWDSYTPSRAMQKVVSRLNRYSLDALIAEVPSARVHTGSQVTFDYRMYSHYAPSEIEIVYVLVNGFAERAGSADSGIKNFIADRLLEQVETRKYAILATGGLYSFPITVRDQLLRQGSGALVIIAEEVASLLANTFKNIKTASVAGYSLGGVLAPLVAREIDSRGEIAIEQVGCGEPNYAETWLTKLQLLKRVSGATAYRNDQINATAIKPYITVKQAPDTKLAMFLYRSRQYRPLLRRALSMRLVVRDLALQAHDHPVASRDIQVEQALLYLAKRGIRINVLRADFSLICQREPFAKLIDRLAQTSGDKLTVIRVLGEKADHGIEEHRVLSTPFLVAPETYWTPENESPGS